MSLKFTVQIRNDFKRKAETYNNVVKSGLTKALVEVWHKQYAPYHFQKRAYFIYGNVYKRRFNKLLASEIKAGKHASLRDPMVHSGTMRRSVLSSIRVSGSSRSIRGYLPGSRVANFHTGGNQKTGGYDMVRELRTITDLEEKRMVEALDNELEAFLTQQYVKKQRRVIDKVAARQARANARFD